MNPEEQLKEQLLGRIEPRATDWARELAGVDQ
jgi:hypothetical protein